MKLSDALKRESYIFNVCQLINGTKWGTEFKNTDMYISVLVWDEQLREVYGAIMYKTEPKYLQSLHGITKNVNDYLTEARRIKRANKKSA